MTDRNDHFYRFSTAFQIAEQSDESSDSTEPANELTQQKVMQTRALIGRFTELRRGKKFDEPKPKANGVGILKDIAGIDPGLIDEMLHENNGHLVEDQELEDTFRQLKSLLDDPEVAEGYKNSFISWSQDVRALKRLVRAYISGKYVKARTFDSALKTLPDDEAFGKEVRNRLNYKSTGPEDESVTLDDASRNGIARQIVRLLERFQNSIQAEIQNIHNQVIAEKRDYRKSDEKVLNKLYIWRNKCNSGIERLKVNFEVAKQQRIDQIKNDSRSLKRVTKEDIRTGTEKKTGSAYVETPSRTEIIYGNESADNYMLSALRGGHNVELHGPTGTGKTKIAIHASKVFSGKEPVVISGGPGVYRSAFYGSPSDLGKRNEGAAIKCLKEDRVLIIDEDNRIDPRQMAEIKYLLGLRPGDVFVHPETGEEITVPPHFRVMVTRNERGKHHKDRFDLPPEYRREFTHASFELDYYTPEEMYDRFFIPKLINEDGSISLSRNEVGGDLADPNSNSPLLNLAFASQNIQNAYKSHKLKNAVMESGYLIDLLDQWKVVQFNQNEKGEKITFLTYLETKLWEFIRRPIGNQDRKIIATELIKRGFFYGWKLEKFYTVGDGLIFTQEEYDGMTKDVKKIFEDPDGSHLTPKEVALLDPFHVREIKEPVPENQDEVMAFKTNLDRFCNENGVRPVSFDARNVEEKKFFITNRIRKGLEKSGKLTPEIENQLNAARTNTSEDFIRIVGGIIREEKEETPGEINEFAEQVGELKEVIKLLQDYNKIMILSSEASSQQKQYLLKEPDFDETNIEERFSTVRSFLTSLLRNIDLSDDVEESFLDTNRDTVQESIPAMTEFLLENVFDGNDVRKLVGFRRVFRRCVLQFPVPDYKAEDFGIQDPDDLHMIDFIHEDDEKYRENLDRIIEYLITTVNYREKKWKSKYSNIYEMLKICSDKNTRGRIESFVTILPDFEAVINEITRVLGNPEIREVDTTAEQVKGLDIVIKLLQGYWETRINNSQEIIPQVKEMLLKERKFDLSNKRDLMGFVNQFLNTIGKITEKEKLEISDHLDEDDVKFIPNMIEFLLKEGFEEKESNVREVIGFRRTYRRCFFQLQKRSNSKNNPVKVYVSDFVNEEHKFCENHLSQILDSITNELDEIDGNWKITYPQIEELTKRNKETAERIGRISDAISELEKTMEEIIRVFRETVEFVYDTAEMIEDMDEIAKIIKEKTGDNSIKYDISSVDEANRGIIDILILLDRSKLDARQQKQRTAMLGKYNSLNSDAEKKDFLAEGIRFFVEELIPQENFKEIFELKRTYRSFSNKFPISYCPTLNDLIDPDLSMKIFGQENLESIEQIAKDNGISGTLPVALNLNVASLRDEDREVKAKHITALDSAMQYMIKLKETQEK